MIVKGDKINDRYQIIKTIGEGGMANVYLAKDTILDRNVAVKVLRGDLADDEKFVRRFQREALSASKLNHPNIVEMYDVGEDNGSYYIVMEYVQGKTLKSLVKKRGALTLPEVIDIMTQLCSAIICAHDSYIIHRDIKPQNVMILDDGRVKIMDFGIAMALNSNELTQTNSVMGSVHYLPPEQANGSGSTIKSDIYSLGILMYELLIGKVPFKGDNAVEIAIKQMKEPIPSICKQNPDIPQSVENIVLRACAKNPKNRYDSVKEMYDDIKTCLTEDKLNQKKLVYNYPEHDLEETKVMPNLSTINNKEENNMKNTKKKTSKKDKALLITGSIFALFVALICLFIIVYPKLLTVPDVTIPDVSNLSVVEAEKKLKELGLLVASDVIEKESDEVEPGTVIGTNPQAGRTVKENTEISIIVAKESDNIKIENYVGQNYKTVEVNLKNAGLNVITEPKKIEKEEQNKYKEDTVVDQSTKENDYLEPGDTIIIYYAVYTVEYPDFVTENYTVEMVQQFCDKNNIVLNIHYETNDSYPEGTIIKQDRTGEVISGSTLTITVCENTKIEEESEGLE
ncbi:MAG TPA: Stk1 family PASTA domain-containing Ser/Thr kinase [Candidatus Faecisoma merdavium]|nr:Stk1 family PASTA domain-containing Ser/Thr kinase [Candidatus Faecisoma merdavium]